MTFFLKRDLHPITISPLVLAQIWASQRKIYLCEKREYSLLTHVSIARRSCGTKRSMSGSLTLVRSTLIAYCIEAYTLVVDTLKIRGFKEIEAQKIPS